MASLLQRLDCWDIVFGIGRVLPTLKLIRNKLEYCNLVWATVYQNSIKAVEAIQRKFLKYLYFKTHGHYPERGFSQLILLKAHDMELLVDRRNLASLSFLYKLVNNIVDCPYLVAKVNFPVPRIEPRNELYFYTNFCRTNVLFKSPVVRLCLVHNKVCQVCDINFDSLKLVLNAYKKICAN
nr:unnamed protein product [Callosobruchus chinensis]